LDFGRILAIRAIEVHGFLPSAQNFWWIEYHHPVELWDFDQIGKKATSAVMIMDHFE
jgi:hypothetical protein